MYKIEAIVRRSVKEQVRDALVAHGVEGVTMTDVLAAPPVGSPPAIYRGTPYVPEVPETKVEGMVADPDVTAVVRTIVTTARTAGSFDGRILVLPIREVVSIAAACEGAQVRSPRDRRRFRLRPEGWPRASRTRPVAPAERAGERRAERDLARPLAALGLYPAGEHGKH